MSAAIAFLILLLAVVGTIFAALVALVMIVFWHFEWLVAWLRGVVIVTILWLILAVLT